MIPIRAIICFLIVNSSLLLLTGCQHPKSSRQNDSYKKEEQLRPDINDYRFAPIQHDFETESIGILKPRKTESLETFENSIGMKLVWIPPGEFMMGSKLSAKELAIRYDFDEKLLIHEHPRHRIKISKGFWMGQYEVTVDQFRQFVRSANYVTTAELEGGGFGITKDGWKWVDGLNWQKPGIDQSSQHPVVLISHNDATAFCRWLSKKENKTYRLPTEAQWEYACRAESEGFFYWGDSFGRGKGYVNWCDKAANQWYMQYGYRFAKIVNDNDSYGATAPVGSYEPNSFGLYDMHGNVWEWCQDWFGDDYYSISPAIDPSGPSGGVDRILRGGSWYDNALTCRAASRQWYNPDLRNHDAGFRVICVGETDNVVNPPTNFKNPASN